MDVGKLAQRQSAFVIPKGQDPMGGILCRESLGIFVANAKLTMGQLGPVPQAYTKCGLAQIIHHQVI